MMSNLWLQVGPSYGFSQAAEDQCRRDFEKSLRAVEREFAVEGMAEVVAEREGLIARLGAWLASRARPTTAPELRRRHA